MPFNSALPEWNKTAAAPTTTKKNAGWSAGEKPPASIFDWFFNTTFLALQELQQKAVGPITEIINGDANTLSGTKFYLLSGTPVNAPTNDAAYAILNVLTNDAGTTKTQEAYNVSTGGKYTRKLQSGTWSAWEKILTDKAPTWTNLTLTGGTTPFQTRTPRYTKIAGQVIIEGEITAVSSNGITMATLPAGYRPPQLRIFKCAHNSGISNEGATIYINTDGTIIIQAIANTTTSISLMGISFFTS